MMAAKTNDVRAAELHKEHRRSDDSEWSEGSKSPKLSRESDKQKRR
jgi:hypothetical protein